MPFKKVNISKIIEKKREDPLFNSEYIEVEKEYELIRQVVKARKIKGLTQSELANIIGVSQQEISRFEREKHMPNISYFIKIVEAVGLSFNLTKNNIE